MIEGNNWIDKGITTVGDALNAKGNIYLTIEYIQNDLQLKCNFLFYSNIKWKVGNLLKNCHQDETVNMRPQLPYVLNVLNFGEKRKSKCLFWYS